MSEKLIATIQGVNIFQASDTKRVFFTADGDIDADGANGQSGVWAYKEGNKGVEDLRNAGYPTTNWYPTILLCDNKDELIIFPDGGIASKTAYEWTKYSADDPRRWVDSHSVPYIVVPPAIRRRAKGVILGCSCKVTNKRSGKFTWAVCADIGPASKVGEISIAAAVAIGINANPRNGGTSEAILQYELFPDTIPEINGVEYNLIRA